MEPLWIPLEEPYSNFYVLALASQTAQHRWQEMPPTGCSQRLQYPLIKEYTVNHTRDPTIIQSISLNSHIEPLEIPFKEPYGLRVFFN